MPVLLKSDENIRQHVMDYLRKRRSANTDYRVIDVGGARNPWCDDYVDAYVDLNPLKTSKMLFVGDINDDLVWQKVRQFQFNFSICTHTLEDIRRPDFVVNKLCAISKAGFIAVPNKHTELSCIESVYWVGYAHHRWIFTLLADDTLRIVAKLPITNYFIKANRLVHLQGKIKLIDELQYRLNRKPGGRGIEWINKKKISGQFELGFIWEDSFNYRFLDADYAGDNIYERAQLYRDKLKDGL